MKGTSYRLNRDDLSIEVLSDQDNSILTLILIANINRLSPKLSENELVDILSFRSGSELIIDELHRLGEKEDEGAKLINEFHEQNDC